MSDADRPLLKGVVATGDGRGRALGFPTANVHLSGFDREARDGVWAGLVLVEGAVHVAVISVGGRSTFHGDGGDQVIEAHLIDFDGDLRGRRVVIEMRKRLREQRRFADAAALTRQTHADVREARGWARGPDATALTRHSSLAEARNHQRIRARQERTREAIVEVVRALHRQGEISHGRVARLVGAPEGLVRWWYPDHQSLLGAASAPDQDGQHRQCRGESIVDQPLSTELCGTAATRPKTTSAKCTA